LLLPCHMTSTSTPTPTPAGAGTSAVALLLGLCLVLPATAAALPGNRSIALETAVDGAGTAAATLAAGCWLEGEVEAVARLTVGSAPAPTGRGATGAVTPEAGLRWAPDVGRWRPVVALAAGVRLPVAGRATTATGLLLGGVERRLGPGWAVAATAGLRLRAAERAAWEAALGVRLDF
jgi:hypothetical protein